MGLDPRDHGLVASAHFYAPTPRATSLLDAVADHIAEHSGRGCRVRSALEAAGSVATVDFGAKKSGRAVSAAIRSGDVAILARLLGNNPGLAAARYGGSWGRGVSGTWLHVATDFPGHLPKAGASIAALVAAGADVNARFRGPHEETPLHWAASSDDVEALDALLDAGADIDAPGAVLGGGPPLADALGFAQWQAARRLVERGALTGLADDATLGLIDRVEAYFERPANPCPDEVNRAFWGACHGGQRLTAEYLLGHGAQVNWIPSWENLTPLDAAARQGADELVSWLRTVGAKAAI